MASLSCIPIPGEVFQNSEEYLKPSQASGVESFWKNCWRFFLQKGSIVDVRLGSKYAPGLFFCTVYVLLEF